MIIRNIIVTVLLLASLNVLGANKHKKNTKSATCNNRYDCIRNEACQCYCAQKCGFRKKTDDDRPVYVKDDPRGYYCYCKQWDLDNVDTCEEQEKQ